MSVWELVADVVDILLNSSGAPEAPGPVTGGGAATGAGSNASGGAGSGSGRDPGTDDGGAAGDAGGGGTGGSEEPAPGSLEALKDAAEESVDWAKEQLDFWGRDKSASEQEVIDDVLDHGLPSADDALPTPEVFDAVEEAEKYYRVGKEGVENVEEYNERRTDILDDILDSRGDAQEGDQ